jgi:curved DNA-binding protein CbpA
MIKKSYKNLALKYHPDRNSGKSEAEQNEASKKFRDVAEAHGVLTDLKKKQLYDSGKIKYDGDDTYYGGFHSHYDSDDIFNMFFSGTGMGGMGGFSGMGGMGGMGGFSGMGGMGGMGFSGMGGFGGPKKKSFFKHNHTQSFNSKF